ncbi:response regulator transcription factor [Elizabethkingia bruuniana]|uniref:Response regulator transcription factor n=1 Tax=Elizabethkingia bruuniana TaxID=1756149 RepID=A0A7T7V045_9FLAO|nr:response regulator transcription factor [Elizabethkingia bruuniana]KGO09694.1 LytTR family transcriptional regulator [Elizabethkingia miricola]AQX85738.1 LytTR family transcriptional regulator [Elizabethkingia bruuniana]KUY22839.1 LytTR family transcriptional regulator [Elizabethkingia bruuniana]OPB68716.1 DNA-binding response regulator [Elizabethkingia bruuniana]QQN59408.1 response regulator transcription factor [Elizabethkingia bruuniana]
MDKINILIVENSAEEGLLLANVLVANNYNITGIASTYEDALNFFYNHPTDLVIIDIFLNNSTQGINLAQTINNNPKTAKPFVFLTSSSDRQIFERAKLTKPFSYLLKPFNELEILYAIEMGIEKFYQKEDTFSIMHNSIMGTDSIFVKKGKSLKKVLIKDIIYIEVEERYCHVVTITERFLIQISLTKILPILDSDKFIRTHRNFIANIDKIIEVTLSENIILLHGNHTIVLSNKYKDFLSCYKIF